MSSSSSSTTAASINGDSNNNNSGLVTIHEALTAYHHGTNSHGGKNIFIDGSWHMPTSSRNARLEYIQGPRIPGALYFDIDDISSPSTNNLPHMKPNSRLFAYVMDIMDICPQDTIYIYATNGCAFVHRTYWTFAYTGYHDPNNVKLIQGSLDEWKDCNGPIDHEGIIINSSHDNDDNAVIVDKRLFHVNELDTSVSPKYIPWKDDDDRCVSDRTNVLAVVLDKQRSTTTNDVDNNDDDKSSSATIIVDARSSGRFYGTEPEPRPGLRGGHIPNSINVPFVTLLNPNDVTKFRPIMEVRSILVDAGIHAVEENNTTANKGKMKVICSCGSGVTAATLAVALVESGLRKREDVSIYDGSWIDWGGSDDTPIETD
jgi:thiosulfate/3-mercaptopyruvate sulfurtransferase